MRGPPSASQETPTGGQRYWECGRPGFPLRRFRRDLLESGFRIVSQKRPLTDYYHASFLLAID